MWDFSEQQWSDHIFDLVLDEIMILVLYRLYLFRCLPYATLRQSVFSLALLHLIVLPPMLLLFSHCRGTFGAWATTILPFGIYTFRLYGQTMKSQMLLLLAVSTLLGIAVSALSFLATRRSCSASGSRKLKPRPGRIALLYRCLCRTVVLQALGLTFALVLLGAHATLGTDLISASLEAEAGTAVTDQDMSVSGNLDTVLQLRDDIWSTLSTDEKLDTLQTIANIEASNFGLPTEINVGATDLDDSCLGCYEDATHTVHVNLYHLENDSAEDVLTTLCHECYHAYEHRITDLYNSADVNDRSLQLFEDAASYACEFSHYVDGEVDYYSYYSQECEADARSYADSAVEYYYRWIRSYEEESREADEESSGTADEQPEA